MDEENLIDPATGSAYVRRQVMRKDGFFTVQQLKKFDTQELFSVKIMRKSSLIELEKAKITSAFEKLVQLNDENIAETISIFEDAEDIFILSEYFVNQTLLEMVARRGVISPREARYYVTKLIQGLLFLEQHDIKPQSIHLSHLCLDEHMKIKYDVGLYAIQEAFESEDESTEDSNSAINDAPRDKYNQDTLMWSIANMICTLIVGVPLDELSVGNELNLPNILHEHAKKLITKLASEHFQNLEAILNEEFFTFGLLSLFMPKSCLVAAPRFFQPIEEMDLMDHDLIVRPMLRRYHINVMNMDYHVGVMKELLSTTLSHPPRLVEAMPDATRCSCDPPIWLTSFKFDKKKRYEIAYNLSDQSTGIIYKDSTFGVRLADTDMFLYMQANSAKKNKSGEIEYIETRCTLEDYPVFLEEKINLIRGCLPNRNIANLRVELAPGDDLMSSVFVEGWYSVSARVVLFCLSTSLIVAHFGVFVILLCPKMHSISISKEGEDFRTYLFPEFEINGITTEILSVMDLLNTSFQQAFY